MARYAISAEGAASMRALAKQLYTEANSILEASTSLEAKVSAVGDGLGIYETEILEIIQQGISSLKENRNAILDLAQRVLQKADEVDQLVSLSCGGTVATTTGLVSGNADGLSNDVCCLAPTRTLPRDLAVSQFGFVQDGDGNLIYDSPVEMNRYLYTTQGSADENFQGTCGLCSCANILRLAGVNASEEDILEYAKSTDDAYKIFSSKLCSVGSTDPGLNGGTTPKQRQQILEHFGVSNSTFQMSFDSTGGISNNTINDIAKWVSEGRGVIVDVHAFTLWDGRFVPPNFPDGHAVTVTSVKKDSGGNVLGFYICDSAKGATTFYTVERLRSSLRGVDANVTTQIIR